MQNTFINYAFSLLFHEHKIQARQAAIETATAITRGFDFISTDKTFNAASRRKWIRAYIKTLKSELEKIERG